jgi:hypothetical protein
VGASLGDSSNAAAGLGACFGFCLIIPAFGLLFYVLIRLAVVVPAIIVENLGPVQAIRRSWGLVYNFWWRTAGLQILLGILSAIITLGPAYLLIAIVAVVSRSLDPMVINIITATISVIASMFYVPLQLTAITLYYFDLRVRKEGFDLETAMQQRYAMAPAGGYAYPSGQYWQPQPQPSSTPPPNLGYGTQPQYSPPPEQSNYGTQFGMQPQQTAPLNPPDQQPDTDAGETRPMPPPDSQQTG